jgi:hypothetical protein
LPIEPRRGALLFGRFAILMIDEHSRFGNAIPERLPAPDLDALVQGRRDEFGPAAYCIEVFHDYGRIVEAAAIIQHERRDFSERVQLRYSRAGRRRPLYDEFVRYGFFRHHDAYLARKRTRISAEHFHMLSIPF